MPKINNNTSIPGTETLETLEKVEKVEILTYNTMLPENYAALQHLSRLISDMQNAQNWAGNLFRGGFDNTDPKMIGLKQAAEEALKKVDENIIKIKEDLASYVQLNNN